MGVAIGAALNEVALGGADVALLGTDLGRLPLLIGLADTTRRSGHRTEFVARVWALSVSYCLAARGILVPLAGALAQSVAVLAIVANSARILRIQERASFVIVQSTASAVVRFAPIEF